MEELENLEETLNESIRESLGARSGKLTRGKHKGPMGEEEEDYMRYYCKKKLYFCLRRHRMQNIQLWFVVSLSQYHISVSYKVIVMNCFGTVSSVFFSQLMHVLFFM